MSSTSSTFFLRTAAGHPTGLSAWRRARPGEESADGEWGDDGHDRGPAAGALRGPALGMAAPSVR